MATSKSLFTRSYNPEDWISWMIGVFGGFVLFWIFRSFTHWTYFTFIFAVAVFFVFALWQRKRIFFGVLLGLMAVCIIIEIIILVRYFTKGFNFWKIFGAIASLFLIAYLGYACYCAFKMYSEFPESIDRDNKRANTDELILIAGDDDENLENVFTKQRLLGGIQDDI